MKIKLDRTVCDGFGVCGIHAPETFSFDEWGYAGLIDRSGRIAPEHQDAARRAVLDCPVHAIQELQSAPGLPGW